MMPESECNSGCCNEQLPFLRQQLNIPDSIALAWGTLDQLQSPLYPAEEKSIASAVEKRRREYIAGRTAARKVCADCSASNAELVAADDGTVLWPNGVIGSLSHSDRFCMACAGRLTQWSSLGIDVEALGRLSPDLWPLVFSEKETEFFHTRSGAAQDQIATIFFCLKEAFFKLQYMITKTVVDYRKISVELLSETTCGLQLLESGQLFDLVIVGNYLIHEKHVIATCFYPRTDSPESE